MIQKILFLAIAFTLTACDQEQVVDDPAKTQIEAFVEGFWHPSGLILDPVQL